METTTANIISTAKQTHQAAILETAQSPIQHDSPNEITLPTIEETQLLQAPATKKKRGRPPISKAANKSPMSLVGSKLSKKQIRKAQISPKRKHVLSRILSPHENSEASNSNNCSRRRQDPTTIPSTSRAPPKAKLIPAIVKGRLDFQNPSNPLP